MKPVFTTVYPHTRCQNIDLWREYIRKQRLELSLKRYFTEFYTYSAEVENMIKKPLADTGLQRGLDAFWFGFCKTKRDLAMDLIEETLSELSKLS